MTEEKQEETQMDYASRRLVELRNAERNYIIELEQAELNLHQAQKNIVAVRARIDEMEIIIKGKNPPPEEIEDK